MAFTLLPKSVFYHIPRTGGSWVSKALQNAVPGCQVLEKEAHINWKQGRKYIAEKMFSFAFVRNPMDWYRSYWNRRAIMGWTKEPLDCDCGAAHFQVFIRKIINGDGHNKHVTDLYENYLGDQYDLLSFVGRYENLVEDLIKALTLAEEEFDEQKIRETPIVNSSDYEIFPAAYTQDQYDKLYSMEIRAIKMLGYEDDRLNDSK